MTWSPDTLSSISIMYPATTSDNLSNQNATISQRLSNTHCHEGGSGAFQIDEQPNLRILVLVCLSFNKDNACYQLLVYVGSWQQTIMHSDDEKELPFIIMNTEDVKTLSA